MDFDPEHEAEVSDCESTTGPTTLGKPDTYLIAGNDKDTEIGRHIEMVREKIEEYNQLVGEYEPDGTYNHYVRNPVKNLCLIKSLPWRAPYEDFKAEYYYRHISPWNPWWSKHTGKCIWRILDKDLELIEVLDDPNGRLKVPSLEEIIEEIKGLEKEELEEEKRQAQEERDRVKRHRKNYLARFG